MGHVSTAESAAPTEVVWALLARPDRWSAWAPHVRGAWGLGEPEVQEGRIGAARLLGVVPVPARVVEVVPGTSWTWRVGLVRLEHRVEPVPGGSRVTMTVQAPPPLAQAYGLVVDLLCRHLARVAERGLSG